MHPNAQISEAIVCAEMSWNSSGAMKTGEPFFNVPADLYRCRECIVFCACKRQYCLRNGKSKRMFEHLRHKKGRWPSCRLRCSSGAQQRLHSFATSPGLLALFYHGRRTGRWRASSHNVKSHGYVYSSEPRQRPCLCTAQIPLEVLHPDRQITRRLKIHMLS